MNPKAIPRTQLLGQIDLDTREWTNGVLTVAALEAVDEPSDIQTWIICDGNFFKIRHLWLDYCIDLCMKVVNLYNNI